MRALYHDKIGLFIHWGPYTQLGGEWQGIRGAEWIMRHAKIPVPVYESLTARPSTQPLSMPQNGFALQRCRHGFMVITPNTAMVLPCLNRRIRITLKILVILGAILWPSFMRSVRRQASVLGFTIRSQDWHERGRW